MDNEAYFKKLTKKMEKTKLVIKKENGSIFLNGIEVKYEPSAEELVDGN